MLRLNVDVQDNNLIFANRMGGVKNVKNDSKKDDCCINCVDALTIVC